MSSFSSVADLARRMCIDRAALLQRFREAGIPKASADAPVFEADVAALSAHYRTLLGARAVEIAAEVRREATGECPRRHRVVLVGQLGSDPETRYMPSGDAVTNIRLATTDRYRRLCEQALDCAFLTDRTRALLYLDLLLGRIPAKLRSLSGGLLQALFRAAIEEVSRNHQRLSRISHSKSFWARNVLSCRTAERESSVHPAFAPPRVVI